MSIKLNIKYLNDWNQVNSCFLKYFSRHPSCLELEDESIVWHPGGTRSCYERVQQENVSVPQKGEVPVQSKYDTTLMYDCKTNCELEIPPRERKCNCLVNVHGHFAVTRGSGLFWVPVLNESLPAGLMQTRRVRRRDGGHDATQHTCHCGSSSQNELMEAKKTGRSIFVYSFIHFQLMLQVFTLKQQEILEQG